MARRIVDALIIGAGPAGATAALMLARAGWSVVVVEKSPFPRRKVCGEFISETSFPMLRDLGVAEVVLKLAGPEIRQVGLYAGTTMLRADMPHAQHTPTAYGRALGREDLDTLLLAGAIHAGAEVCQPWTVTHVGSMGDGFVCTALAKNSHELLKINARVVISAHGSWERGSLPTQRGRQPPHAHDLFAFKAHFLNCSLPMGLMPLVVFPGGYGGMVHSNGGRTSFSCCIRRDFLSRCRHRWPQLRASTAVVAYVTSSCRGVAEALAGAECDGAWLSAGPIRPGIRPVCQDGIFSVGNAAGEAHPIVAEGISMAIQGAGLLCSCLIGHQDAGFSAGRIDAIARAYGTAWRANFAPRIRAAAMFAYLAMRPGMAVPLVGLLRLAPTLLTLGAGLSGKTRPLRLLPNNYTRPG